MIKKILSLLVALVLIFSVATALAEQRYKVVENFDSFNVEMTIPDGMEFTQNSSSDPVCVELWFADQKKPKYELHVAPSEEFVGRSLADLTEEEYDGLLDIISEDFIAPEHERFTTPSGNLVLLTRETDASFGSFATMQTVYRGFFFYLYCAYEDYAPLTDDDIALMHRITEGLDIEPVKDVEMPPAE